MWDETASVSRMLVNGGEVLCFEEK